MTNSNNNNIDLILCSVMPEVRCDHSMTTTIARSYSQFAEEASKLVRDSTGVSYKAEAPITEDVKLKGGLEAKWTR